jgi:hypothetical protein
MEQKRSLKNASAPENAKNGITEAVDSIDAKLSDARSDVVATFIRLTPPVFRAIDSIQEELNQFILQISGSRQAAGWTSIASFLISSRLDSVEASNLDISNRLDSVEASNLDIQANQRSLESSHQSMASGQNKLINDTTSLAESAAEQAKVVEKLSSDYNGILVQMEGNRIQGALHNENTRGAPEQDWKSFKYHFINA